MLRPVLKGKFMEHWEYIGEHIAIKDDNFDAHKIIEVHDNHKGMITLKDGGDSYYEITITKDRAIDIFEELVDILRNGS